MADIELTVGAIILDEKDNIFLLKSNKWSNKYCKIGGHLEKGESLKLAIKREILEEAGLVVKVEAFLGVQNVFNPRDFYKKDIHFTVIDFLCRTENKSVKLNSEAQDYFWGPIKEALKLNLEEYAKKTIIAYLEKKYPYLQD